MQYAEMWPKYAAWWDAMTINASRLTEFTAEAKFAVDNKSRYEPIANITEVPWPMIACIHRRESNADFNCYLGNGQPLDEETTIVPRGRGPFTGPNAFFDGACDAIAQMKWNKIIDWRLEKQFYYCELFNGAGYYLHGIPSPYIWGGTNIQEPGKYVADGAFNPVVMDSQPGCAPLLQEIAKLDPSVVFTRETAS